MPARPSPPASTGPTGGPGALGGPARSVGGPLASVGPWPWVYAGTGIVACLLAVLVGGAAAPLVSGLADAGPAVRWSLPLVGAVRDLTAALAIGAFLVAATLVPAERAGRSARMLQVARLGVPAASVWVVASLAHIVLSFGDIAGVGLTAPGFWTQLTSFLWSIEALRVQVISAMVAALALAVGTITLKRTGVLWAAGLSLFALLPLALGGHAAGSSDHETAVNTIAFHYVGAAVWAGGIVTIALARRVLGRALPVVLARYSRLAAWCLGIVGVSGLVAAWIRLDGLASVLSAYGALLIAKGSIFAVLGLLGLAHRRRVVGRLTQDPSAPGVFARLVAAEVALMGAVTGVAAALAVSPGPTSAQLPQSSPALSLTGYPMPSAPTAASWLTTWRWDWLFGSVAVLAIAIYLAWVVRLARRGDHWPWTRTANWVIGWLVFLWATNGAPAVYGRVSFSWHMTSHMVISMAAPLFAVMGAPISLALRALPGRRDGSLGPREILTAVTHSRYVGFVANPVVAALNFFVSLIVFYYSGLFPLALTTHTGHVLMTVHFFASGYLFAWSLVGMDPGPRKWPAPVRLLILAVTVSFHAFFGVALMSATDLLAPDVFGQLHVPWVDNLIADQQLGGSITWGVGDVPSLWLAMLVTWQWSRSDARAAKASDRQADRDNDAELTAYNDRLAKLSRRG